MQTCSPAYHKAVYDTIRQSKAKITFEILDDDAYEKNKIIVTTNESISRQDQLLNKVRETSISYATYEHDFFKLDGTFAISDDEDDTHEVGWISESICDTNGMFEINPVATIEFSEFINTPGFTIIFDKRLNEYADTFSVKGYRSGEMIYRQDITGNKNTSVIIDESIEGANKIQLEIVKWAKPYRRSRVVEIDIGLVKEYTDDEIVNFNIIEELDTINSALAANEMTFTINNSDKQFNILNPNGIYRFINYRQAFYASLGIMLADEQIEYVSIGKYYLTDWKSDEGALTATFTGRDILNSIENVELSSAKTATIILYSLTESILKQMSVKSYQIDDKLKEINVNSDVSDMECKELLQCIGVVAKAVIYQDRDGILQIKCLETLKEGVSYINHAGQSYSGLIYTELNSEYRYKTISLDNQYKIPQVSLDSIVNRIEITYRVNGVDTLFTLTSGVKEGKKLEVTNPLIYSEEQAKEVAEWLMQELGARYIYECDWRQNPALECGDNVLIEDGFKAMKQSRIVKQEFEYTGYLRGRTTAKGGV